MNKKELYLCDKRSSGTQLIRVHWLFSIYIVGIFGNSKYTK